MPLSNVHYEPPAPVKPKLAARASVKSKHRAGEPRPWPARPAHKAAEVSTPRPPEAEPPAAINEPGPDNPPDPPAAVDSPAAVPTGAGQDLPAREFKSRLEAARGRLQAQSQDNELETLLDQAITLLDTVSRHPALQDYSANQRKLEEIEQRLGYGAYPQ